MIKLFGVLLLMISCALMADSRPLAKTVVILMGPPGSGKGTQATYVAETMSIPHISTGEILREQIRQGSELGKRVQSYVEAGQFAPDDLILDVLFTRVSAPDAAHGYLLDGFPRNLVQAEALDKRLGKETRVLVLNLRVSDELIVKRIAGRLSCPTCGAVYNKHFDPPKVEGACDREGSALIQRADDREEVVVKRLKFYHEQTAPLIDYYKKKGVLIDIDGEKDPKTVSEEIQRELKRYSASVSLE